MQLHIADEKGVPIQPGMIGLFFEDINYAADGGLYAEMIENRSFEFLDCSGTVGNYYTTHDCGYGWHPTTACAEGGMAYVMGSPVNRVNPHYLRFTATQAGQGFYNQAYSGIHLEKGMTYNVSFYARMVRYPGDLTVSVEKEQQVFAQGRVVCVHAPEGTWQRWIRYELTLEAKETVSGARFVIALDQPGVVEFDLISMMPADAVAGVFRRDLFELLKGLHPGFLRFPGGCIIEGNTLENRYRWKESVGAPEGRRSNFNRWAVHGTSAENGWHTRYAHYNQTLGIGFYEYFLLCEMTGAKPLPVVNVGLACQYQSYELVEMDEPGFAEFIQDALDLIEFANGPADSRWGSVRAQMGHPAPFGLTMMGIGNEQWQTDRVDFFARYTAFEQAIHVVYHHTGEMRYLRTAERIADTIVTHIPESGLIPVDFCQPAEPAWEDSCGACVIAGGLLELAKAEIIPAQKRALYLEKALLILRTIDEKRADWSDGCDSIVLGCSGAYHDRNHHFTMVYADYYFVEAIARLRGSRLWMW